MTDLQQEIEMLKNNVNREIYGMDKPKEEMLRYYLNFRMGHKSSYTVALCGPPGVGKTIFFQVFAKHIKIPFKIIQGGCITDVGYIQGGLKIYIGAGAGCITDAIHEAKQEDIMIIFDELEINDCSSTSTSSVITGSSIISTLKDDEFISNDNNVNIDNKVLF